jgi:hypothetical protein
MVAHSRLLEEISREYASNGENAIASNITDTRFMGSCLESCHRPTRT